MDWAVHPVKLRMSDFVSCSPMKMRILQTGAIFTCIVFLLVACKKNADFVNEDTLGNGIHYYPQILNERLLDTLSGHYTEDTIFEAGQRLTFELLYFSHDSIQDIQLWAGPPTGPIKQIGQLPYDPSFFSYYLGVDTTWFSYVLPDSISPEFSKWHLKAVVTTRRSLNSTFEATIRLR